MLDKNFLFQSSPNLRHTGKNDDVLCHQYQVKKEKCLCPTLLLILFYKVPCPRRLPKFLYSFQNFYFTQKDLNWFYILFISVKSDSVRVWLTTENWHTFALLIRWWFNIFLFSLCGDLGSLPWLNFKGWVDFERLDMKDCKIGLKEVLGMLLLL